MSIQARTATSDQRQPTVLFELKDDPELFRLLNTFRVSVGWTWKRLMLTGIANSISKTGDNHELVVKIADYLEKKR